VSPVAARGPGEAGHVVLVGLMGSGKSTVGRRLAKRLDRPFVDADDVIVEREGRLITEIYEAGARPRSGLPRPR
jgi:shikimate kinase